MSDEQLNENRQNNIDENENGVNLIENDVVSLTKSVEANPSLLGDARRVYLEKFVTNDAYVVNNSQANMSSEPLTISPSTLNFLEYFGDFLSTLHVNYCENANFPMNHRINQMMEQAIVTHCRHSLIEINIYNVDEYAFSLVKKPFVNVTKVYLESHEEHSYEHNLMEKFNSLFPNAQNFDLVNFGSDILTNATWMNQKFANLKHFSLMHIESTNVHEHVKSMTFQNPQLTSLELRIESDDIDLLLHINENLHQLEELVVNINTETTAIPKHLEFKKLKKLFMWFSEGVMPFIVAPNLEELSVAADINEECLQFISRLKNISKLYLDSSDEITIKTVYQLTTALTDLPKLCEFEIHTKVFNANEISVLQLASAFVSLLQDCKCLKLLIIIPYVPYNHLFEEIFKLSGKAHEWSFNVFMHKNRDRIEFRKTVSF